MRTLTGAPQAKRTTKIARVFRFCALAVFAWACANRELQARVWITVSGQTFEGDFVRQEGDNGIFKVKGQEYLFPISQLRVADRLFVGRLVYEQRKAPSAPSNSALPTAPAAMSPPAVLAQTSPDLKLNGQILKAGDQNEIDATITGPAALKTVMDAYGKPSTKAKMLVALPNDFDPMQRNWPLLIVSATTDGAGSSIGSARANYLPDATSKGYVVLAVDGEFGKPPSEQDSTEFRWALVSSALDTINKEWPKSKAWPIATAGVSGGAGYASHQAMMLVQKQAPVIGMLLAVSGWDPVDFPDVLRRTPFAPLHNLPVFMSAGETDSIATKQITDQSHQAMMREGFRKIRFEHFPGGHELYRAHLQAALDWFLEERAKSGGGAAALKR